MLSRTHNLCHRLPTRPDRKRVPSHDREGVVFANSCNFVLAAILLLWSALAAHAQDPPSDSDHIGFAKRGEWPQVNIGDPRLNRAMTAVTKQAATFWQEAPNFVGREMLTQKAVDRSKKKPHFRQQTTPPAEKTLTEQQLDSCYAFSVFTTAPEAILEFRRIVSINGKQTEDAAAARRALGALIASKDNAGRQALLDAFEKENHRGAAVNFGQLILLFIRSRLNQYTFTVEETTAVGNDRARIISFKQTDGGSLKITEPGRKVRVPLQGELYVREDDDAVLRIAIKVIRADGDLVIRDEARVDYSSNGASTILPATVLYRRYLNNKMYFENTYAYSDWQAIR